jgi:hypothetical protein
MKKAITITVALLLLLGAALVPSMPNGEASGSAQADAAAETGVETSLMNLPLYFIENQGQLDGRVAYYVQGRDMNLYFTARGVTFAMSGPGEEDDSHERYAIKLEFVGADPNVQPLGKDRTEAIFSYFTGSPDEWKTGLPTYAGVIYPDLWPGIDLVYSGDASRLKYAFLVRPGADPGQIRLAYSGASAVTLNGAGQLEVSTPSGGFNDDRPVAYQDAGGHRVPVEASYALDEEAHSYGFQVGSYDPSELLAIDPAVLVYCGYIGSSGVDVGNGIAVDGSGCAYVTGYTNSNEATFPVTVGPDTSHNGNDDAFVAKVNASGTGLDYCGYIGGSADDWGRGIAVDGSDCAYVTGRTYSDEATFPVFVGPYLTYNGSSDVFVAKVWGNGSGLDYCGYIGGSAVEWGGGIAVDGSDCAYVTGSTSSNQSTFPVLGGPDLSYNGGSYDAFVAKVSANGTMLDHCGYIGGADEDQSRGIAVDGSGCAYVTGYTSSNQSTFPVLGGPDLDFNDNSDAFVARVSANGTGLDYCGYIGGNDFEWGYGIAVDVSGCAYVVGRTRSDEATFPVAVGPYLTYNGNTDAFVSKVNAGGSGLAYCGYIGGSQEDLGHGIAVDGAGCAYVTGWTESDETTEGFPVAVGPDTSYSGGYGDAFVSKVKAGGTGLDYCGYIGGSQEDLGHGIAVDSSGCAYVAGYTDSDETTEDFPVTVGPDLEYNKGSYDAFVAKVCYTMPVGGVIEPVDKISILAPLLGLAALIVLAMSVIVITQRKRAT